MNIEVANLWLDHDKFGCGWRDYVAMPGRKWVRLVLVATGESARIPISEYERAKRGSKPWPRSSVARRLRRNAKTFGNDKAAAVKDALAGLRAGPVPSSA